MTAFQETVEAVKEVFPKFSPAALSLAQNSANTGVQLVPRAKEIADGVCGSVARYKRRSENRVKSVPFRCRMCLTDALRVKHELEKRELTQQDLLEALLLEWVAWAEKEPLTVCKTDNGSEGGDDTNPAPSSKITQNEMEVNK